MGAIKFKEYRKPLRAISLIIALGGSLLVMVFSIIISDALSKTEESAVLNIDETRDSILGLENTIDTVNSGLENTDTTLGDVQKSIMPLSSGLHATADALDGTASALSAFSFVGLDLSGTGDDFKEGADSMRESAETFDEADSSLEAQKEAITQLRQDLAGLKTSVSANRVALGKTKASIQDIFGLAKIANLLFFLIVVSMFLVLSLNSVAGLI